MTFQIKDNKDNAYFIILLSGPFKLDDLESCYIEMIKHPLWKSGTDVLWDARECSFNHLKAEDMQAISLMTEKYREERGSGKAAWVVSRDVDYGVSRMFELLNEKRVVFNFHVFRTMQDAENWIHN